MELSKRTPEEQAEIDEDRKKSHVVSIILTPLFRYAGSEGVKEEAGAADNGDAEAEIESAYESMRERAMAAGMVPLATSMSCTTVVINNTPYLSFTLIVNWMEKEELEKLQRRQTLAGVPPGGRSA